MRILGIDPGSRRTGYGLIEATPQHNRYLFSGCIRLPESKSLAERLVLLGDAPVSYTHLTLPTILRV